MHNDKSDSSKYDSDQDAEISCGNENEDDEKWMNWTKDQDTKLTKLVD